MIQYKTETKTVKVAESITCDRCNKDITAFGDGIIEIRHEFGFGSEVDGEYWEFDICEDCLNDTITQMDIKVRKFTSNTSEYWDGV